MERVTRNFGIPLPEGSTEGVPAPKKPEEFTDFQRVMKEFGKNWSAVAANFINAVRPAIQAAVEEATRAFREFALAYDHQYIMRRAAIEYHGIAESDIKRVEGRYVRLWNHRKVHISHESLYRVHKALEDERRRVLGTRVQFSGMDSVIGRSLDRVQFPGHLGGSLREVWEDRRD